MQAFVTVNGLVPSNVMIRYPAPPDATVADLCAFAASKAASPEGCSFKVSMVTSIANGQPTSFNLDPDVILPSCAQLYVIIDPPDSSLSINNPVVPLPSTPVLRQSFNRTHVSSPHDLPQDDMPRSPQDQTTDTLTDEDSPTTASRPSFSSPVIKPLPSVQILLRFYVEHASAIDDAVNAMNPVPPVFVHQANVYDKFSSTPASKASLFVLRHLKQRFLNEDLILAAQTYCKRIMVDILVAAYPDFKCPPAASAPMIQYLAKATNNEWFSHLFNASGKGLIESAFQQRRKRHQAAVNILPTKKKIRLEPPSPEDLESAVIAFAKSSSSRETKKIAADTARLRCSWIQSLQEEEAALIPETFMKKFPSFIADASLLHEDYKCNMAARKLPVLDFSLSFKSIIPGVLKLATSKKLLPSNDPAITCPDPDAWLAFKLLIQLVPKYCRKSSTCTPERLFVEGWDSSYVNALHQVRRDLKQSAPMIYVVTNFGANTKSFYVATDDVALKVHGPFLAALQSLFELHYVFDLAYAKELHHVFTLLEHLAGQKKTRMHASLYDLYSALHLPLDMPESDSIATNEPTSPAPSDSLSSSFGTLSSYDLNATFDNNESDHGSL